MADERQLLVMTQRKIPMETAQHLEAGQAGRLSEMAATASRRTYCTPQLTVFGNLRGITLGGSPGISDSGQNNMQDMVFFTDDYNSVP